MMLCNQADFSASQSLAERDSASLYKWDWTDYTPLEGRDHTLLIFYLHTHTCIHTPPENNWLQGDT